MREELKKEKEEHKRRILVLRERKAKSIGGFSPKK